MIMMMIDDDDYDEEQKPLKDISSIIVYIMTAIISSYSMDMS